MTISRRYLAIFFVIIGALLSVVSAIIYDQVIDKTSENIKLLESSIMEKENIIKSIWQNNLAREEKKDTAFLILLSSKNDSKILRSFIADTLASQGTSTKTIPKESNAAFSFFISEIERLSQKSNDQINNLYIDKITLQEKTSDLKKHIDKFSNAALFLQIIGLMMVLSKDIFYNRHSESA